MTYSLTPKQKRCMLSIEKYIDEHEYAPSYDELATMNGLSSKSGIYRLVNGLVERGYLGRLANRARSMYIIKRVAEEIPPDETLIEDYPHHIPFIGKLAIDYQDYDPDTKTFKRLSP